MALAKLTKDSIASDNNPTESVIHHAQVFMAMVMMATTTEARNRPLGVNHLARNWIQYVVKSIFLCAGSWLLHNPALLCVGTLESMHPVGHALMTSCPALLHAVARCRTFAKVGAN